MLHYCVEFSARSETSCLRDTIYTLRTQTITERVAYVQTSPSLRKNRRGGGVGGGGSDKGYERAVAFEWR